MSGVSDVDGKTSKRSSGGGAEHFDLRPGLDEAECVDLLLTYSGPSIHRQVVVEYSLEAPATPPGRAPS